MAPALPPFARRGFLIGAGGAAVAGSLAACGTNGKSADAQEGSGELPTYVESKAPDPDLPGDGKIVEPGYTGYPSELATTVPEKPGKGSTYTGATIAWSEPASNKSDYATFLNEKLGATLNYNAIPSDDYGTKISAIMASGKDLPDFVVITGWSIPPKMLDAYKGQFRDLSQWLAGDAVKKFPNLAAIPTPCWKGVQWIKQIAALPVPSPLSGFVTFKRTDKMSAAGVEDPKSLDELKAVCEAVHKPDEGTWATSGLAMTITRAHGLPLGWAEIDGEITHPWLSDKFTEGLAFHKSLWDAGLVHPDIVNASGQGTKDLFMSGKIALCEDGHDAWRGYKGPGQNPTMDPAFAAGAVVPFAADGTSEPRMFSELPTVFLTFVSKKLKDDQVEELLRIMNYLAAPFGSEEFQNVAFGKEGVHFEMKDGAPVPLPAAAKEVMFRSDTVSGPRVTFDAAYPDWVQAVHDYQEAITPMAYFPKTAGMYVDLPSELASAEQEGNDAMADILRGRKEISAWDGVVKTWRDKYSGRIKDAYEKALEENS